MKSETVGCIESKRQFVNLGYPTFAREGVSSIGGSSAIFQQHWKYGLESGLYILLGGGLAEYTKSRILQGHKRTYFAGCHIPGVFADSQWQIQMWVVSQIVILNAGNPSGIYEIYFHLLVGQPSCL